MARPNFDAPRELHISANDLLHSPVTQRALVNHEQGKWVHEVSEASLRMVDVCGNTKGVLLLVKDHLQDLQSAFRRISASEAAVEDKFEAHTLHRKRLRKDMMKRMRSLKGIKNKCIVGSDLSDVDQTLVVVVKVLREVRVTTMAILKRVDSPRLWEKCDAVTLQTANKRLETEETAIEDLEFELESMFRRLIQTRVSLLNILTK
ncbi:hypothetical protein NMG60_11016021 [Bertholletia excelsa]